MTSDNHQLSSAAPEPAASTLAATAHMINTEDMESPQAGKMRRNLTSSTPFTHSTSSDNSLSDIAPCMENIGYPLSPRSSDDDSSDDEDKNHLKKALESVGRKVQEWTLNQKREKQLLNEHMLQAAQREVEFAQSPEGIRLGQKRLYHLGEMGATLFSPIEGAFAASKDGHESNEPNTTETVETDGEDHLMQRSDSSCDEEAIDHFDIQVAPDDDTIPRLLSEHTMRKLMLAMPYTLHGRSWKRCYSITRDGDSFAAFRNGVKGYAHTLIVIQTTKGEILGGFADAAWEKGLGTIDGCFFGTGTSFLFSLRTLDKEDPIQIFRWQGVNEYSQLCRKGDGCVGMGGGGGCFGIFLQEDFTKGSSGACNTFGNATPLTSSPLFDVLNLEVYGFERGW